MIDKLVNNHDIFFKKSLEQKIIANDFFKAHLPKDILKRIDLSTLKVEKGTFSNKNYKQWHTDMLFSVNMQKDKVLLYLLAEHQSTPDKLMPLRMLEYVAAVLRKYADKKTGKFPVVIPLVYYHGKQSPYPYSTDILDYFNDKVIAEKYLFKPFQLVDLTQTTDDVIAQHKHAAVMEMLHKHAFSRDILPTVKRLLATKLFEKILPLSSGLYLEIVLYYICLTEASDKNALIDSILETYPDKRNDVMSIAEQFKQEGKLEGKLEGKREGRFEEREEIARRMLVNNFSPKQIEIVTGVVVEGQR